MSVGAQERELGTGQANIIEKGKQGALNLWTLKAEFWALLFIFN